MTHISPGASLSWAIYTVLFEGFLLYHLWNFDRFKCLKWSSVNQPGAFKRFMTYTYLSTLPLLMTYSISSAVIKYQQGYVVLPELGIIPKPYQLWPAESQAWIIPLYFVLAIGWALEMVTHLEELLFWFFLLRQNGKARRWFTSIEFRLWVAGSLLAIIVMPLVVGLTRADPLKCEAWLFFVGSTSSTSTTVLFIYILYQFPRFLQRCKTDGADPAVVARLSNFHQLNIVRVVFRFVFTLPLLALSLDGVWAHNHPVNENPLWTDLFIMVGGLGSVISSGITLLIFFPRPDHYEPPKAPQFTTKASWVSYDDGEQYQSSHVATTTTDWNRHSDSTVGAEYYSRDHGGVSNVTSPGRRRDSYPATQGEVSETFSPSHARNRYPTVSSATKNEGGLPMPTTSRLSSSSLHPYISNFTSPIDFADDSLGRAL